MKKAIFIFTAFAVVIAMSGVTVLANGGNGVNTEFKFVAGDAGAPIIKAKWETPDSADHGHGTHGTQLMPIGQWEQYTDYTVCAVATDPNGVADIFGVYAEIYYPAEFPGCDVKIEKNELLEMGHAEGIAAFESAYGENLVHFNSVYPEYDYAEVLWELNDSEAKVYCHAKQLWYEDPHGNYLVSVHAVDNGGVQSVYVDNYLEYAALTSFEIDFDKVNYGDVKLDTKQIHSGDTTFGYREGGDCTLPPDEANCLSYGCYWYDGACHHGDGRPTVRNIGNTWLKLRALQNDMGLGKTSGVWNVKYDIRLGPQADESDSTNVNYLPEVWSGYTPNHLGLSETEKLDFSIRVYQATPCNTYIGTMDLDAGYVPFSGCCNE